jgi:peptidyl-prolyl cis-trans isomerase D
VEPILKQEKAELIKAKMTGSSMEAAKSAGSTVLQATDDYGKSNVNRCGLEPKVGTAFALGANKMSAP